MKKKWKTRLLEFRLEFELARRRIYELVIRPDANDAASVIYDYFMIICIIVSLLPLTIHVPEHHGLMMLLDRIVADIFILDYLFRWGTADYKLHGKGWKPFLQYPFTFMAIVDLLSILPSMPLVMHTFRMFMLLRILRVVRVLRVIKVLRYSRSLQIIRLVLGRTKDQLMAVMMLAVSYIFVVAMLVFNLEPQTFETFFDAVYWSTVSLTTVGYGDLYPVTVIGRLVGMVSSFFGIAIVALPAGIITAGYMEELAKEEQNPKRLRHRRRILQKLGRKEKTSRHEKDSRVAEDKGKENKG